MATLALDTPQRRHAEPVRDPQHATLHDVVARAWSSLVVTRAAPCVICGGEVAPRYGSGAHPVGGTCRSCATEMS